MKALIKMLILAYQRLVSPLFPNTCRFHPSCSQYCLESVEKHGVVRGVLFGVRRISRCHPFSPGGYDPVH